ncbi:hypothetical protein [Granulicella tundricola]|uniref:Uncharacterized protein n=1 Tax=Granulicella tundricola (strain ATCC BAA-1859 / DSM 23138 / MP5ACTX9) TaxID=1198114 RepID=E8X3D3_GRATM|nr:hypothetical protein [Granulicella tundricola]ADW70434.1 hypothetical protein AciX9_3428 [Granulicella tundricola MP5ACTX9]
MKMIVRTLALALLVTGAVASANANTTSSSKSIVSSRTSAMPVPTCPPDDPNGCGIGAFSGK